MIIISDQSSYERQLLFHNNNRTTDFTSGLSHKYIMSLYKDELFFKDIEDLSIL